MDAGGGWRWESGWEAASGTHYRSIKGTALHLTSLRNSFLKNIYVFIYLAAPGLSCCMWDLVP